MARRFDVSARKLDQGDPRRRLFARDVELYKGVASLVGSHQTGHARGPFLRAEETQIGNSDRGDSETERRLDSCFEEASEICRKLEQRGYLA